MNASSGGSTSKVKVAGTNIRIYGLRMYGTCWCRLFNDRGGSGGNFLR